MKKILAVLLFCCIIQQVIAEQQIPINPSMALATEIPEDYSVVYTFLYPSTTHSVTTLPKDFYVKKLKDSNISLIVQKAIEPENEGPKYPNLSFAHEDKEIKITPSQTKTPPIRDYHAVISIYPEAKVSQPNVQLKPIEVTFDKTLQPLRPAQPAQPQVLSFPKESQKKNSQNQDKEIQWKVKNVPPVRDYVVEGDKQYPLSKSLTTSQLGTAQLVMEQTPDIKPSLTPPRTESPPQTQEKKPLLYNAPKKTTQNSNLNVDQKDKTINGQNNDVSNPKTPNQQMLKQIQKLRYKSHKWSIVIVILILVILFIIFLFIKCLGKRDIEFWQNLNKKLDNYRNSSEVAVDEEEQVMASRNNELIQNEQQ